MVVRASWWVIECDSYSIVVCDGESVIECTTFGLEYSIALSTRPESFMGGDSESVSVMSWQECDDESISPRTRKKMQNACNDCHPFIDSFFSLANNKRNHGFITIH